MNTNWGMIGLLVILGTVFVLLVWNGWRERKGTRMSERVTETCPVCGAVNDADKEHNCGLGSRFGIRIEWDLHPTRMIGSSWFEETDLTDDDIRGWWNFTHPNKKIRSIKRNQEIPDSMRWKNP